MRLHTLRLTAIGPFPGTHTIDFATLSASGLFLLEGPTGAGKSTVIDAVVFALYGGIASNESSRDRIASRHAPPGTTPVVELVFETAAGIFRIRRSPEHLRPKQRGSGMTREHAQVRLWRLSGPEDGEGQPLSSRAGEADAEILRVVGLSREQFVQTVVLPQGEFATFLRAAPEERRVVLQRLFGTEIFQRMQDCLAEAARAARREVEGTRADAKAAVASFLRSARQEAADDEGEGALNDSGPPATCESRVPALLTRVAELSDSPGEEIEPLAQEVLTALTDKVASLSRAEEEAAGREREARLALEAANALARDLATRSRLMAERVEHEARRGDVLAADLRLAAAQRATGVLPAVSAAEAAESAARAAVREQEQLRTALRGGPDADLVEPGADLAAARSDAEHELGALTRTLALERSLPERRRAVEAQRDSVRDAERAHSEAEEDLADRPGRRDALETALAGVRARAAEVVLLELRLTGAERVLAGARQAEALSAEVAQAGRLLAKRAAESRGALERLTDLRRRRISEIAGELASALADGHPCPVCGADEHPTPAPRSESAVTSADVDAAEEAASAAESSLAAAREVQADVEARLRVAQAASDGRSAHDAEVEVRILQNELDAAKSAQDEVRAAEGALADFDRTTQDLRALLGGLQEAVVVSRERLRTAEEDLARDEQSVLAARVGHPTVAARAQRLAERVSRATRLDAAERLVAEARRRSFEQAEVLSAALAAASFSGPQEAVAAALDPDEASRLEHELQRYHSEGSRIAAGLAEPAIARLTGAERPDVGTAEGRLEAAVHLRLRTTRLAERTRAVAASVAEATDSLTEALDAHATAARAAEPVTRMAELAAAGEGNDRRHTLATFVLLRRFEEVLAAANLRLATMSDGRYALARTDDREGGVAARRTGLALVVEDLVVGDRRAPRTLSGGETFYVSLCLALGLADVVRAEAGGIDLGTLFIDEGFGTLDPETLDTVMRELGRLRSGGRVVGIVSHVAELKRQVAERIEVRRRPDGSSTLAVVA